LGEVVTSSDEDALAQATYSQVLTRSSRTPVKGKVLDTKLIPLGLRCECSYEEGCPLRLNLGKLAMLNVLDPVVFTGPAFPVHWVMFL